MDWGVAYHPYPCPMTDAIFWDDAKTGLITNDLNSPVVNFINLNVLTDYLATPAFQKPQRGGAQYHADGGGLYGHQRGGGTTCPRFRRRPTPTPTIWWTATPTSTPTS